MKTHFRKIIEEDEEKFSPEYNEPGELGYETGDDAIEMEKGEGEKIVYGSSFSPADGDEGDESDDRGDLPSESKRNYNYFDPTLSDGSPGILVDDELKTGISIVDQDDIGMAYNEDQYVRWEDDFELNDEEELY